MILGNYFKYLAFRRQNLYLSADLMAYVLYEKQKFVVPELKIGKGNAFLVAFNLLNLMQAVRNTGLRCSEI